MNEDLKDIQSTSNSSEIMSVKELSRFIERNKEAGLDTLSYEVDYHAKFGFAFASFVMTMLGVPFSVSRSRSGGTFANIGICMGLAFGYWVAYSSAVTLGRHGAIPPIFAAWGPNVLAITVAWLALRRPEAVSGAFLLNRNLRATSPRPRRNQKSAPQLQLPNPAAHLAFKSLARTPITDDPVY